MEEIILRHLERSFPYVAKEVATVEKCSEFSVLITTVRGEYYIYNDLNDTIRKIFKEDGKTDDQRKVEFGNNLREKMVESDLSQGELASLTGISTTMLSLYMNGRASPTFVNVQKLAYALGCSVDDFTDKAKLKH